MKSFISSGQLGVTGDVATTGNWTKTPNEIYAAVPDMSDAELRVTTALIRQTYGYRREKCSMTYADFRSWGIASDQTVDKGIKAVLKRGFFQRGPGRSEWIIGENSTDFVENNSTESVETTESVESAENNSTKTVENISTKSVENPVNDSTEIVELHSYKEKERKKERGEKKLSATPTPQPFTVYEQLSEIEPAIKKGQTLRDAKALLEGDKSRGLKRPYTLEEIIDCGRFLQTDPWRIKNMVNLDTQAIIDKMDKWIAADKPPTWDDWQAMNPTASPNGRPPILSSSTQAAVNYAKMKKEFLSDQ